MKTKITLSIDNKEVSFNNKISKGILDKLENL